MSLITQVSENIETDKKDTLGRLSYYLSAVQTVKEAKSFDIHLSSKEQTYQGQAVMVLVGNGSFTGGIQAFFPNNSLQDGLFDVLVLKDTSLPTFWSILHSSLTQEDRFDNQDILHFQTKELTISCNPVQKVDCDGERKYYTPTRLNVLPKHLTMIVGNFRN